MVKEAWHFDARLTMKIHNNDSHVRRDMWTRRVTFLSGRSKSERRKEEEKKRKVRWEDEKEALSRPLILFIPLARIASLFRGWKASEASECSVDLGVSECRLVTSLRKRVAPYVDSDRRFAPAAKEKISNEVWRNAVNPYLAGSHRLARYEKLRINVIEVPLERLAAELLPQGLPFRYVPVLALRKLRIISPEILPRPYEENKRVGGNGRFRKDSGKSGGMRLIIVKNKRRERGRGRSETSEEEIKPTGKKYTESFMDSSFKAS